MAESQYQRLALDLAEVKRKHGMSKRVGTVHQVWRKDGVEKVRIKLGEQPDGTPWLSPWLHTSDHRGPHRQQEKYHVGQNVELDSVDGDFRQATISPWAENKKHLEPDNANDYDHTYQHHTLMERHGTDFQRYTLADPDQASNGKLSEDKFKVRVTYGTPPQRQDKKDPWDGPPADDGKPKGVMVFEATEQIQFIVKDKNGNTSKVTITPTEIKRETKDINDAVTNDHNIVAQNKINHEGKQEVKHKTDALFDVVSQQTTNSGVPSGWDMPGDA